jgi:hypothetical protein
MTTKVPAKVRSERIFYFHVKFHGRTMMACSSDVAGRVLSTWDWALMVGLGTAINLTPIYQRTSTTTTTIITTTIITTTFTTGGVHGVWYRHTPARWPTQQTGRVRSSDHVLDSPKLSGDDRYNFG